MVRPRRLIKLGDGKGIKGGAVDGLSSSSPSSFFLLFKQLSTPQVFRSHLSRSSLLPRALFVKTLPLLTHPNTHTHTPSSRHTLTKDSLKSYTQQQSQPSSLSRKPIVTTTLPLPQYHSIHNGLIQPTILQRLRGAHPHQGGTVPTILPERRQQLLRVTARRGRPARA